MPRKKLVADQDKVIVRLPDGMRDKIKEAADSHERSMNAEIVARLAASFVTIEGDEPPVHIDPAKALYVLLDADGHPTSWPEIDAHLSALKQAGDLSPEIMHAQVFNSSLRSSSEREAQWWDLLMHYRKLRGLPDPEPMDDDQ